VKKVTKVSTTAMVNGVGNRYLKALVYFSEKDKLICYKKISQIILSKALSKLLLCFLVAIKCEHLDERCCRHNDKHLLLLLVVNVPHFLTNLNHYLLK